MDTKTLTLVFTLDNGDEYNITVANPKDDLSKSNTDTVMQKLIDVQAVLKDGHFLSAIKESYITITSKQVLE